MRAAFRMIGQVLTIPIGIAHEGVHWFAAALVGLDAQIVVRPNGSSCMVDFDSASPTQQALVALAPTLTALMIVGPMWAVLADGRAVTAVIVAIALMLFGVPTREDLSTARKPFRQTTPTEHATRN